MTDWVSGARLPPTPTQNARLTPRAISSATAMESRQMVYLVPRSHSCHSHAISAGIQGTRRAARDRETRREPSTCPCARAVPKLIVRVRLPSPAPYAKNVAAEPYSRISVLFQSRVSVHARATLGHTYPHLVTEPSASADAQLVPSRSPAVFSPVLPTSPKGCPRHN